MRRFLLLLFAATLSLSALAQGISYVNATDLGIHGHTKQSDKSPYYRFDHTPYEGFSKAIMLYSKCPSGLYIVFKTNSTQITARWENVSRRMGDNMTGISQQGLDLYIKSGGEWCFAAVGRVSTLPSQNSRSRTIIKNLAGGEKECLLYLPGWCELTKLEIGVDDWAIIEGMPTPFKHKVIVHGSSITHGASASRAGLNYPALLSRNLGINFVNFGFSGQCKLQPQFLEFLKGCEADAFVFDAFSNSTVKEIKERLRKFVKELAKAHPGKPLIFLQSPIDQESAFDVRKYEDRIARNETAAEIMKELSKENKDVYFLAVPNVLGKDGSVDGSHPNDLGFDRFLKAYQPKIAKILKKYGIKGE